MVSYLKSRWYNFLSTLIALILIAFCWFHYNDPKLNYIVFIFAAVLFVLYLAPTLYIISRTPKGQLLIRQKKRKFNITGVALTIFYILFYFGKKDSGYVSIIVMFFAFTLVEILNFFLYKYYKPISLIIDGTDICFYDRVIVKRNLENLSVVELNDMENKLQLYFYREYRIEIILKEFVGEDLLTFLDTAISISQHSVEVQKLVYTKLQPPPPPLPFFKNFGKRIKDTLLP